MKYEVEASEKLTVADRISIHSNFAQLKKKSDNTNDNFAEHVTKHCLNVTLIENPFKTVPNSGQNSRLNSRKNSTNNGRVGNEACEAAQVCAFLAKKNLAMSQNIEFSPTSPQKPKKISNDVIRIRADSVVAKKKVQ